VELLWVGSIGGMEQELVERAGIAYRGVPTGKLRGANPVKAARSVAHMAQGVRRSRAILREWRPDACFVTGGYVCAPVVAACRLEGVPVLIYLPDMSPGWTIRWMSKVAQRVAVSFPEVAPHFGGLAPQGKAVVTGYPVRQELVNYARDRAGARRALAAMLGRPALDGGDGLPLVLVWGGSQGSRNINRSTWGALAEVLPRAHVLHVVGTRDWPLFAAQQLGLAPEVAGRYHPVAYLHEEMAPALAAADLSVARAGASTLGEFPVARLPSVLVPLVSVNQTANAELLVKHGGAVMIEDEQLPAKLAGVLVDLIRDETRRRQMEAALERLAQPDAAQQIAREIVRVGSIVGSTGKHQTGHRRGA
jgi:UDP-N-acetylglucosamine--N-acetylmuramyl-(pentapeptide) pyrophosphoryl-undecaprenol N-acetylglucosamine transferase